MQVLSRLVTRTNDIIFDYRMKASLELGFYRNQILHHFVKEGVRSTISHTLLIVLLSRAGDLCTCWIDEGTPSELRRESCGLGGRSE